MDLVTTALFGVMFICLCGVGWNIWGMVCNERTANQRAGLIDAIFSRHDYRRYLQEYEAVSYDQHVSALAWHKDPKQLYGPLVQELWGSKCL